MLCWIAFVLSGTRWRRYAWTATRRLRIWSNLRIIAQEVVIYALLLHVGVTMGSNRVPVYAGASYVVRCAMLSRMPAISAAAAAVRRTKFASSCGRCNLLSWL